jgi:hypothetical protein
LAITGCGCNADPSICDQMALPWSSIDNDDWLALDQLTACERLPYRYQEARANIAFAT